MKISQTEQTERKVLSTEGLYLALLCFSPPSKPPLKMHECSFGFSQTFGTFDAETEATLKFEFSAET